MRWALVVWGAFLGCANARSHFVADEAFDVDVSRFHDAEAVVLLRHEGTEFTRDDHRLWTQRSRHELLKVLKPGVGNLAVEVPRFETATPVSFAARVSCPGAPEQTYDERALSAAVAGVQTFTFPPAAPGCVLEHAWEFTAPGALPWTSSQPPSLFPVARSTLELRMPRGVEVEVGAYNGARLTRSEGNDGTLTLRVEAVDLAPFATEDDAPHWTRTAPWWQWRLTSALFPVRTSNRIVIPSHREFYLRSWRDVVAPLMRTFSSPALVEGFDVKLDFSGCDDPRCLGQRAVDLVQRKTVANPRLQLQARNLAEVWKHGDASAVERVLLVKALLDPLLPNVSLAFGSAKLGRRSTPDFPTREEFDRLLLHVGASSEVQTPFILDPNCEGCAPGTLPAAYAGTQLFVAPGIRAGEFVTASNAPAVESTRVRHLVAIDASGVLVDQLSRDAVGAPAAFEFRSLFQQPPGALHQRLLRVNDDIHTAVREAEFTSCSLERCAWNATLHFPAEARCEGGRWYVPLRLLAPGWAEWLLPAARDNDVHLKVPLDFEEIADLAAPPGFALETVPAAVRFSIGGFQMELVYERTPTGARVTRRMRHGVEVIRRDDYPQLHEAVRVFRAAREQALVFAPTR